MKKIFYLFIFILTCTKYYSQVNKSTIKNSEKQNTIKQEKAKNNPLNNQNKKELFDGKPEFTQTSTNNSIPKRSYAVDWITPKANTNEKITVNSKIELGVNIPDSLSEKILSFIEENDSKNKLNPFDPEELNIVATFEYQQGKDWKFASKKYAFYYQDFKRITNQNNIQAWTWEKTKTNTPFRIRYSPNRIGKWRVLVIAYYKGVEQARMGEFEFSCMPGKNKDFVKLSKDKKSFSISRESFLPIGQNLSKPSCFIFKDKNGNIINDPYSCSKLPCAGTEEFCSHSKEIPLHLKAYTVYLEEIKALKLSGANSLRMMIYPHTFEIEFEKLGDYSKRLNCAWELDKVLETVEKENLKLALNLFSGYSISKMPSNLKHWDWYKDDKDDIAYCYNSELKLNEPSDFLTNSNAKKHFKNRLRYYFSRYSYSTSIEWFELINEINKIFPNNPKEIYSWNIEMLSYIKNDLFCEQLLTVNYDENGANVTQGDLTFNNNLLDFISMNFNSTQNSKDALYKKINTYQNISKPVVLSEIYNENSNNEFCNDKISWVNNLWTSFFLGSSNSGFNMNLQHDYETWKNMNILKSYFNNIDLNFFNTIDYETRADNLMEIIVRKDTSNTKALGLVNNLTWNYYSQSNDETCKQNNKLVKEHLKFTPVIAGKKKKATYINLKADTEFIFEWYSPIDGKMIDSTTLISDKQGKLNLIHPNLDEKLPFAVFKCYTKTNPLINKNIKYIRKTDNLELKQNNKINNNQNKLKQEDK